MPSAPAAELFVEPDPRSRIILALDLPSREAALAAAAPLAERCTWVKVGLELYLAAGPGIVAQLADLGFRVFLDLKLHDIPNTVAGAIRSVAASGASLLTLHATGGTAMLQAAAAACATLRDAGGAPPALLAVTVLTSLGEEELAEAGVVGTPAEQVLRLGRLAIEAGILGLVCSALELRALRAELGPRPLLIVPGIRPVWAERGDQSRIATPAQALADGASALVIGRPVLAMPDPISAFERIVNECQSAQSTH